jgi:lipopolysaccharide export system permease protein
MLTGVLLTLGRLSSDSEITAMRAAGLSIPRIALPVLAPGGLGVALGLRVNFESMPWARVQYEQGARGGHARQPAQLHRAEDVHPRVPGYVVYIGSRTARTGATSGSGSSTTSGASCRFVRAESGRVDYDEAANEFIVTLANARVEEHDRKKPDDFSQPLMVNTFGQVDPFRLSLAKYFGTPDVHQKLQWMTYGELTAREGEARAGAGRGPAAERSAEATS